MLKESDSSAQDQTPGAKDNLSSSDRSFKRGDDAVSRHLSRIRRERSEGLKGKSLRGLRMFRERGRKK